MGTRFSRATAAAVMIALGGCRSIKATYVDDAVHGEEVGGLPIVVMQPRYLKVTYACVTWRRGSGRSAHEDDERTITTETIDIGRMYAIDVERPAAGTADWSIALSKDRYYPDKIGAKVHDSTIATAIAGAEKIADAVASARGGAAAPDRVKVREAVERIEIYDLRDLANPVAVYR